jgi:hypothetical protein
MSIVDGFREPVQQTDSENNFAGEALQELKERPCCSLTAEE